MATKQLPPPEVIRQFLRYEPDTGAMYWRDAVALEMFSCVKGFRIWHTKYAGREAFTSYQSQGYRVGAIRGKNCLAHRVAAVFVFGDIGLQHIDHINGIRDDNRAVNLRIAAQSENMKNAAQWSHNTSGHTGVVWHKSKNRWGARIKVSGRSIHLGLFDKIEDAISARKKAESDHGFHKNHGRKPVAQRP